MIKFYVNTCTLILLVFIKYTVQDDNLQCPNNYSSTSTMMRLKKHAFCQYDTWIRPVKNKNDPVDVRIRLFVKRIDFNDRTEVLTVHSLFLVQWNDFHVVWKPSEFDDTYYIRTNGWYLWTPDLGILNAADKSATAPNLYSTKCLVYSSGSVVCVPYVMQAASCSANLRQWPYDVHTCYLVIGSWMHMGESLNLTLSNNPMEFEDFNLNREWHVSESGAALTVDLHDNNLTYPYATFKFVLERHSGTYAATVVVPAGVVMLVNLMSYWMDPRHSDRIVIITLNIFSHFVFLQYLGYMVATNGDETPIIVTFFRDSLILNIMALLITTIVRGLRTSSRPVPLWAAGVSNWVLQSRVGQIIVFHRLDPKAVAESEISNGDGADPLTTAERSSEIGWNNFTTILNFVSFLLSVLTYFVLFVGYVP